MNIAFQLSRRVFLASTMLAGAVPALARVERLPYRNPSLPVTDRVRDLLSRMTLEEKVAQMRCIWSDKGEMFDDAGNVVPDKAAKFLADGIGQIARPSDMMGVKQGGARSIANCVALVNAIQHVLVERTRLGIPALFHEEAAHGYAASDATVFPIPLALGSTWDTGLVERVFGVAGREARVRGATVALAPVIDLALDARFGRVEEMFGEDPHHVAQMGVAAVRGLQGRTRPLGGDKIFATLKHFVHGSPEGGVNLSPVEISDRGLMQSYLVPFRDIIRHADPAIIMPSYNEVQGMPAHASTDLLVKKGRELLGFKGAYFSDYSGVSNLAWQHHVASNEEEAAVLALEAGVDADLPHGSAYRHLVQQVKAGRGDEKRIDMAVARILALKFEAGLFENAYADARKAVRETSQPEDVALARLAAQKAIVLLKNDGVLPLDPQARRTIAVIGPNAAPALFGGYSGYNDNAVGLLAGLRAAAGPDFRIEHAEGVQIVDPLRPGEAENISPIRPADPSANRARIAEAVELAKRSDLVILAVGDVPQVTHEAINPDAPGDRATISLFGDQDALVDAVLATGKPVVAVLLNGRPLAVKRLADGAKALIEGWYLGQEGGNALADVIFGKANPGGKLSVSIPRGVGNQPAGYRRHPSAAVYRYIEEPRSALFPFGFGLSYTSFELSEPRLDRSRIAPGETVRVMVDVRNVGERVGDEVIQLYIRDEMSSAPRPLLELKGFERVTLAPGEMRTVVFVLGPDQLVFLDKNMRWTVEPGSFAIHTGNSTQTLKSVRLDVA
jgi:beta-glucosidase